MLLLIVHLLLGFRRLRDVDYYRDDPVVLRLLGLRRLPDVATLSRALAKMGHSSIAKVRHLSSLVMQAPSSSPVDLVRSRMELAIIGGDVVPTHRQFLEYFTGPGP